ncbi:MAG: penicillin-binding transpeptidase domain-containing protein [Defluviitaleaceae bacterium]|nr:penicillin-binding transpeptidase domain-containing protein [Defluviitaleaceae bacterium]
MAKVRRKNNSKHIKARRNTRMVLIGVFFTICISALLLRIGYITITYGAEFERYATRQFIRRQSNVERDIPPQRGAIFDRNRLPLVDTEPVFTVALDVNIIHALTPTNNNPNPQEAILAEVHRILDIPMETLWGFFDTNADGTLVRSTRWRVIANNVSMDLANQLAPIRHVYTEHRTRRLFPEPFMAPQVLGLVRGDSAWGLEHQYRSEMNGEPGRIFRSFQSSDAGGFTETIQPRHGYNLVTTLDANIQRIAQRVVNDAAQRYNPRYVGIVVMQPQTGEILAMAQWPSFSLYAPGNPTYFTDPRIAYIWDYKSQEEQHEQMFSLWRNLFLTQSFEPGSIFKPIVVAAALESGAIDTSSRFTCHGRLNVADWVIHCHNRNGCGVDISLERALQISCNIATIHIAREMGSDTFYKFLKDFGFGERTNIDLPGEEAVSSSAVMYTLADLRRPVELATSSFGQGFNNTSIQAINSFAAIINGGYVLRPYVVSQIVDNDGNIVRDNSRTVVRNVISQETSDWLRTALHSVVTTYGTGRRAIIDGHSMGGKTGTGQQGVRGPDGQVVNSFLAYMPVENPQFLAMAVIFNPEDNMLMAGASAAPMVRDVFQDIIRHKHLPPDDLEQDSGMLLNPGGDVMDNFIGMELREVTRRLNNMGVDFSIVGQGSIVESHIPPAGRPVPRGIPIIVHLDNNIDNLEDLTFMPSVQGLPEEQAVNLISAAGLRPIVITSGPMGSRDWSAEPVEGSPLIELSDGSEFTENWVIYRQFPAAGVHIQRDTHVRLRSRIED